MAGVTTQQISIREMSRRVSAFTLSVKNKSTQRVGAFKCLFTLESGFQRTPSCSKFVLRFNSGLWIGFIRIEFHIRCRENFVDICTVFAMGDGAVYDRQHPVPREQDRRRAESLLFPQKDRRAYSTGTRPSRLYS